MLFCDIRKAFQAMQLGGKSTTAFYLIYYYIFTPAALHQS